MSKHPIDHGSFMVGPSESFSAHSIAISIFKIDQKSDHVLDTEKNPPDAPFLLSKYYLLCIFPTISTLILIM